MPSPNEAKEMTLEDFKEWESNTFGYGYGTGEAVILPKIRLFLDNLKEECSYDHEEMEKILGETAFWLLLNALCKSGIIDYGTSPRYGWLSEKGEGLRDLYKQKTNDELYEFIMKSDDDYDSK